MNGLVTMGMFGGNSNVTVEVPAQQTFGFGGGGFGGAVMPKLYITDLKEDDDINIDVQMKLISDKEPQ